jgi:hypothetical protein
VSPGRPRVTRPLQWLLAGATLLIIFYVAQAAVPFVADLVRSAFLAATAPQQTSRPGPNPLGAFAIELSQGGGAFEPLTITTSGVECQRFEALVDLESTCFGATNLIPSIIGGGAQGNLNQGHTPEYDALVWRARANGDPQVCDKGGLLGALLSQCRTDATRADYALSAGNFVIRVPIGGAFPSPGGP